YRLLRVRFIEGLWARMLPAHSDLQVIDEANYDWSQVTGRRRPDEAIDEYLIRKSATWRESGVCPNPRFYQVDESAWLHDVIAGSEQREDWRHFLILGHDAYVEVIANGMCIEEGQSLDTIW